MASADCSSHDEDIVFADRADAGIRLAAQLLKYRDQNAVVLGVPRGGVRVAFEVARALKTPLDVIIVRKLGAPDSRSWASVRCWTAIMRRRFSIAKW